MALYIDIETYSSVDLRGSNPYRYSESPDFEILVAAWAYDDDPVQVAIGRDEIARIPGLPLVEITKIAHNAPFERICFSAWSGRSIGNYWPSESWEDTAALAAAHGYPRGLDNLAKALGVSQKDSAGTSLINWFCKPDRNGKRRMPEDYPEKWKAFVEYCRQDVVTLRECHRKLPDWPKGEREVYLLDQRINDRGIAIDVEMAKVAVAADEESRLEAGLELQDLLGVNNAGSVPQITSGLERLGLSVPNLRKETIDELLSQDLTPAQRRALELRQKIALVAAKKYQAALDAVSGDGRLRGQFVYGGAHTLRWSSRGVQVHNFPRVSLEYKGLNCDEATRARLNNSKIEAHVLDLMLGLDASPPMIKALLRSLVLGPLTVVDYSAIEARMLAWLAGETWVLEAFRNKRDIYVETANRMSTSVRTYVRQEGKVAVLALGYQGGVEALRGMGAEGTDEELNEIKIRYRVSIPKTKRLWSVMERAFIEGGQAGRLRVVRKGADRHVILPSGRPIVYHNVRVVGKGYDRRILFDDPRTGRLTDTYGGRLVENATQGACRDLLAEAIRNLEAEGFPVVLHVHDEAAVEGVFPVAEVAAVMCRLPAWADEFPIDAEGFTCSRYRKG